MAETLGAGRRRVHRPKRIQSDVEPKGWVYILGAQDGHAIKIGETRQTLRERIDTVNRTQMTDDVYHLLAAVRGSKSDETQLKRVVERKLGASKIRKGHQTEYYEPCDKLIGWVNWLRAMSFSASSLDDQDVSESPHVEYWLPDGDLRYSAFKRSNGDHLFDPEQQLQGPLAGTYWRFLRDPQIVRQDYFTDPPIVHAASLAMDGIDCDVASHKMAQRRFLDAGIDAPRDYFTKTRSAFENDWIGSIWLNPPYGENDPWFRRYLEESARGHVRQLCMISPVHAFTTQQARLFMAQVQAMVLLSPTPPFFNPGDPNATGTNLPHCVVYCGGRASAFLDAFSEFGIRMELIV